MYFVSASVVLLQTTAHGRESESGTESLRQHDVRFHRPRRKACKADKEDRLNPAGRQGHWLGFQGLRVLRIRIRGTGVACACD